MDPASSNGRCSSWYLSCLQCACCKVSCWRGTPKAPERSGASCGLQLARKSECPGETKKTLWLALASLSSLTSALFLPYSVGWIIDICQQVSCDCIPPKLPACPHLFTVTFLCSSYTQPHHYFLRELLPRPCPTLVEALLHLAPSSPLIFLVLYYHHRFVYLPICWLWAPHPWRLQDLPLGGCQSHFCKRELTVSINRGYCQFLI